MSRAASAVLGWPSSSAVASPVESALRDRLTGLRVESVGATVAGVASRAAYGVAGAVDRRTTAGGDHVAATLAAGSD